MVRAGRTDHAGHAKPETPAADLRNAWDEALRRSTEFYNLESCMYNAREKLIAVNDVETACRNAVARAVRNHAPIYMIGSLYLLGEARGVIEEELRRNRLLRDK